MPRVIFYALKFQEVIPFKTKYSQLFPRNYNYCVIYLSGKCSMESLRHQKLRTSHIFMPYLKRINIEGTIYDAVISDYACIMRRIKLRLTGWTRAGTMFGRTTGYLFSQAFILIGGYTDT